MPTRRPVPPPPAVSPSAWSPRRSRWRRALFQVHLWTGLGIGLYALVISVSGSILVYAPQLGGLAHRTLREVPAAEVDGRRGRSAAEALGAVRSALPDSRVLNVQPPVSARHAHGVGLLLRGGAYRVVFVHPTTGAVSAPVHGRGDIIGWIEGLHSNFFAGRRGRVANGVGGLLLVLLAITGAIIWWPGRGRVGRALRIGRGVGWKRLVFDLHNALGMWLLLPVVLLSVTGAYFTWPQVYRDVVSRVSPVTRLQPPVSVVPPEPAHEASVDVVIDAVRRLEPTRHVLRVDLPGGAKAPYVVVIGQPGAEGARDTTTYFLDRYSGGVLEVRRPGTARTRGDRLMEWIAPLHTGHFGGYVVHATWAVLGLAPAVLFLTGFLMWWNRIVVPLRRRG